MAEDPPGLILENLKAFLVEHDVMQSDDVLQATLLAGGRSNVTYALQAGDKALVIRRPPLGHVLATAHDMGREYRIMTALGPTAVPVPATVVYCADTEVIGAPFYVMAHVDGHIYKEHPDVADLPDEQRRRVAYELIDVLARLHDVDPQEVGLSDFGNPIGYLERQVRRWGTQMANSNSRVLTGADELSAHLSRTVPQSKDVAIVHGDYRLDNVVASNSGEVIAVLDWELSTIGDPLADLALFQLYWDRMPPEGAMVAQSFGQLPGFPSGEELFARYREQRAITLDPETFGWYQAFAAFKLAAILEGIYYRSLLGKTLGEKMREVGELVEPLIAAGLSSLASTAS